MRKSHSFSVFISFLLTIVLAAYGGEVLKPEKISASSELKYYAGHLAKFAGDDNIDLRQYWCTDFKNGANLPQWLEFDFGSPQKFNQISLFMHPKFNKTLMLDDFKLEYWTEGKWSTIVKKQDYNGSYSRPIAGSNFSFCVFQLRGQTLVFVF